MQKLLLALLLGTTAPAALAQTSPEGVPAKAPAKAVLPDAPDPRATPAHNTGFGLKSGYSRSSIYGNGTSAFPDHQSLPSFFIGAYGQLGFNKFASVQVELLYSRKGYRTTLGSASAYNTRLDYLDLPLLFVGNITPNVSFHVGPQVSALLNVARDGSNLATGSSYNSLAVGGVGGLEARFGNARLGARYDLTFSKLYAEKANVQYNNTALYLTNNNIHNRALEVYLSYGFSQ